MTTCEAADKWHIGESTVRRYCATGVIEKCDGGGGSRWIISDESLPPYDVRKNSADTQAQKMAHIFKALNEEKTISPASLRCDRARLDAYFAAMSRQNLIYRDEHQRYEDPFGNYFINRERLAQFRRFPDWKVLVNWILTVAPLAIQMVRI